MFKWLAKATRAQLARACALVASAVVCWPATVGGAHPAQDAAPEVLTRGGWVNVVEGAAKYARGPVAYSLQGDDRLRAGDLISTGRDGRVEVLLNPGYYLRLGAQTECRLLDTRVDNLKLQLHRGTAAFEVLEHDAYLAGSVPAVQSYELIAIVTPSTEIVVRRAGLYRINVAADRSTELLVRDGEALAGRTRIKAKRAARAAGGAVSFSEFDPKVEDPFDVWCRTRAQALIAANRSLRSAPWRVAQRNGAEVSLDVPAEREQSGGKAYLLSAVPGLVKFVESGVAINRVGAGWQELAPETALQAGDALRTGPHSRAELLLLPDVYLRLDGGSEVAVTELSFDAITLKLTRGAAILDVVRLDPKRAPPLTLAGPAVAFTITRAGNYRLDVKPSGAEILVRKGRINIAGQAVESCQRVGAGVATACADDDEDGFDLWSAARGNGAPGVEGPAARMRRILNRARVQWTGFWYRQSRLGMYTFVPHHAYLDFRSPYGGKYSTVFMQ